MNIQWQVTANRSAPLNVDQPIRSRLPPYLAIKAAALGFISAASAKWHLWDGKGVL